jgi:hypothetical protein
VTTTAIPKYGIVEWLDAASHSGKPPKKPRARLCRKTAIGMLALVADGTLVITHEYDKDTKGLQRSMEGSIIPMGWVQTITALVEGADAVHPA